ncbi:g7297 [Coccomyxa elongata]
MGSLKGREAAQLEKVEKVERLSDLKSKAHHLPVLVAVSGKVWTDAPLKCELVGRNAAIAEVREEQQFMRQVNSGEWVRDQHVVRQTWREAPWCLEDASHVRLPVIQSRLARRLHLELAGDVFTPAEKGVTQRALDQLMGWRVLGQRHKERILPVGATITAIGELAASSADTAACKGAMSLGHPHSILVLQAPQGGGPFILSYEKLPEIIASLNRVSRTCKLVANCFIGVGTVLITIKVIQGACRFLHRRKIRKRLDAEARRRRLLQEQNGVHANGNRTARPAADRHEEERDI